MSALAAASFADPYVALRREVWPLSRPEELIERLQQGTARMAGLISAQDPALPPYVGALPPRGEHAWDWHATWKAKGKR